MIFVGIDVASQKHDVAILSNNGEILSDPFTISNDTHGFKKLHEEIQSHMESHNEVHIGIEETGIYSKNICEFLALCGFIVHMINPVLTSNSRKSQSVRLTKNDKIDAMAICKYVGFNYKRLNSYTPTLYIYEELKSLSRARLDIQSRLIKAKTEWVRLLDISFPEFRHAFNHQSKWAYQLFYDYGSYDKISRMHLNKLSKLIKTKSDRNEEAIKLKHLAKNSIGQLSKVNAILIKNTLNDIKHYSLQMDELEKEITLLVTEYFPNILTIPGVGPIIAGLTIGEVADINRFYSPGALLAFTGLDPIVYESGKFKATNVSISKRGSKYLRTAIFTATRIACVNPNIKDNKFRDKYQKKRNEGKHHNSAICHAAKNMVNVIYKLLISGEKFDYSI